MKEEQEKLKHTYRQAERIILWIKQKQTTRRRKKDERFLRGWQQHPEVLIFLTFFKKNSKKCLTDSGFFVILTKLARESFRRRF